MGRSNFNPHILSSPSEDRTVNTPTHSSPEEMALAGHTVIDQRELPYDARKGLTDIVDQWDETPIDPNLETKYGRDSHDRVVKDFNSDDEIDDHFPDLK